VELVLVVLAGIPPALHRDKVVAAPLVILVMVVLVLLVHPLLGVMVLVAVAVVAQLKVPAVVLVAVLACSVPGLMVRVVQLPLLPQEMVKAVLVVLMA
jgi:hypothetical protein